MPGGRRRRPLVRGPGLPGREIQSRPGEATGSCRAEPFSRREDNRVGGLPPLLIELRVGLLHFLVRSSLPPSVIQVDEAIVVLNSEPVWFEDNLRCFHGPA